MGMLYCDHAILIQTPDGQNILIDGGPGCQQINLELSKKLPFWDRTIGLVVCTQPHADHVTGLVEVLKRYKVKQVLEPGVPYDASIYHEWLSIIGDKGIEYNIARAGQYIDLGTGIRMEILNPPQKLFQGTSCDIDNNGVVLKLTWNKVSFLFTADIREEAELELIMQRANLRSTVLKVSHHGSGTSTIPLFLAAVGPEVAVISAGADNPFGHPSPEVVERLIDRLGEDNFYRTDEDGTIEFITDGERLWIKTENEKIYSVAGRLQWESSCRSRTPCSVTPGPPPTGGAPFCFAPGSDNQIARIAHHRHWDEACLRSGSCRL